MEKLTTRQYERLMFDMAKTTLSLAGVTEYTDEEVWSMVMLDLINIEPVAVPLLR